MQLSVPDSCISSIKVHMIERLRLLLLEPLRHVLPPAKARKRLRLLFRRDIVAALCFLRDPFHPFLLGFVVYRIGIATAFAWGRAAARSIRAGRDVK